MRCRAAVLAAAALLGAACGGRTGSADGLTAIGAGLRGPAGARASVYATGLPAVSAFAFDARGRLWAATASYTSEGQDWVYLVAAPGAAPVRVITGLRTPLGLAWIGDWLYVASLGRVDAYGGFDGAAFARSRTILDGPVAGSGAGPRRLHVRAAPLAALAALSALAALRTGGALGALVARPGRRRGRAGARRRAGGRAGREGRHRERDHGADRGRADDRRSQQQQLASEWHVRLLQQ
jgi:hypothetical protein